MFDDFKEIYIYILQDIISEELFEFKPFGCWPDLIELEKMDFVEILYIEKIRNFLRC